MALVKLRCPRCSAEAQYDEDIRYGICVRCGAKVFNNIPKRDSPSYRVVFELKGVESNDGKGLYVFIDSKRYRMDIWPNNRMELSLTGG